MRRNFEELRAKMTPQQHELSEAKYREMAAGQLLGEVVVEERLKTQYVSGHPKAQVSVYRYNPVSIRIRVVDPDFEGMSIADREDVIWKILEKLPEDIISDISVGLFITPEEQPDSLMNFEFDHPSPSLV